MNKEEILETLIEIEDKADEIGRALNPDDRDGISPLSMWAYTLADNAHDLWWTIENMD